MCDRIYTERKRNNGTKRNGAVRARARFIQLFFYSFDAKNCLKKIIVRDFVMNAWDAISHARLSQMILNTHT